MAFSLWLNLVISLRPERGYFRPARTEVLFDAYNESSGFDNAAIKAEFEELHRLMNGKPLKEIDEIIYAVCTLCRNHEQDGFEAGVKAGICLAMEVGLVE